MISYKYFCTKDRVEVLLWVHIKVIKNLRHKRTRICESRSVEVHAVQCDIEIILVQ